MEGVASGTHLILDMLQPGLLRVIFSMVLVFAWMANIPMNRTLARNRMETQHVTCSEHSPS